MQEQDVLQEPIKDENAAHPIASAWRATFQRIVKAFAERDYSLARGIPSVSPVPEKVADQVRDCISSYGEELAELPDATWESSVSQWMWTHWEVLMDLWTVESGSSDLVLSARVFEEDEGFRIEVDSVYVP